MYKSQQVSSHNPEHLLGKHEAMFPKLFISGVLITSLLAFFYIIDAPYIRYINFKTTDLVQLLGKQEQPDRKIIIVDIDEESLISYGQWPWPRYRVAELLEKILAGNPLQIGVNIIFAEKDQNSPEVWQQNLKRDFDVHVDLSHLPEKLKNYDHFLADVLRKGPFTLGYAFLFNLENAGTSTCELPELPFEPQNLYGPDIEKISFYQPETVVCSRDVLAKAAGGSGFLNGSADSDGIVRRLPLVIKYNGKFYASFGLAILRKSLPGLEGADLSFQQDEMFTMNLVSGEHHFPVDNNGNFLLSPVDHVEDLHLSASDLLEGRINTNLFKDSIMLVGTTAAGLDKIYSTPFASKVHELDLHSQFIKSLMRDKPTVRNHYFAYCEVLTSFLLLVFLVIFSMRTTAVKAAVSCLAGVGISFVGAVAVYRSTGLLFSPLLPACSVLLNCCALTSVRFYYYQRQAKSETGDALLLLKSSETTLQSVLNAIPDIVFRLDQDGRFVFISPAIRRYVEKPESLLGESVFKIVAPEDMEKARGRINERRTGDRATADLEIRLLFALDSKPVSEDRYFRVRTEGVYREAGQGNPYFLGTQGIIRDITEHKKLEDQLLQAQKMEAIGNMAAGIAHDLNNILSGLVSYPELLLMEVPKDSTLHQKISVIHKSGKMAAAIVQDLLFLARRGVNIRQVCNVNEVIAEYLNSAEFKRIGARHEKSDIITEYDKELSNINGSPVHLTKVIMNLVHNGLEAMPAGGHLLIRTMNIEFTEDFFGYEPVPAGKYVCIRVEDSGVGLAEKDMKRIFEPFYSKKSLGKSGTGLGMTVIWATIKDHLGYLDISSAEGVGTKISIYLPVSSGEIFQADKRIVIEDYVGDECILVVDDIPEQLEIATNMLKKLGYEVLTAKSGEEAVEIYGRQPVDLVVLDMIMPGGMDGLETYESLQSLNPDVRAIIASGHSETARVVRLQELGAGAYIQKPYTLEGLGVAVRSELERQP